MKYRILLRVLLFTLLCSSCSDEITVSKNLDETPPIFPDYRDVTIPPNIAPLNFGLLSEEIGNAYAFFHYKDIDFKVKLGGNRTFQIPSSEWKELLQQAQGDSITIAVYIKKDNEWVGYTPFNIHISKDSIDPYIAYRLIQPGYVLWNKMGIYQRNLETYDQHTVIENNMIGGGCVNCHSFSNRNPQKMLFHIRAYDPGTVIINDSNIEKVDTKTDQTMSSLVYPSWHPSGNYVAFSVNKTQQAFHATDPNRVEVFDMASDVVVYDVRTHEIVTAPPLFNDSVFETFPTFSPDGKTLYYCAADSKPMPNNFADVKYSLYSLPFDPETRTFGNKVDTLFNAKNESKSVSFPRVSPDGKYLMYTLSSYGNFSIWHKDADLYMIDLSTRQHIRMDTLNSDDVESYHSWSSNSRWVVFSSRRIDGLYTRPYIAHISENGTAGKPFLLPQKDIRFYHSFMRSYNIPEFVTGKIDNMGSKLAKEKYTRKDVTFVE